MSIFERHSYGYGQRFSFVIKVSFSYRMRRKNSDTRERSIGISHNAVARNLHLVLPKEGAKADTDVAVSAITDTTLSFIFP